MVMAGFIFYQLSPANASQWLGEGKRAFEQINEDGFGDRHNSYAWSMEWFKGKLYVGTNRDMLCYLYMVFGEAYPVDMVNVDCPEDPDFRAEIWRFDPQTNEWECVFLSEHIILEEEGRMVARDQGYRGMAVVIEPDGKEALYVGGYLSKVLANEPARLLRTTDGENFQEVKSTDEGVLGNSNIFSLRSLIQYNKKLYLTAEISFPREPKLLETDLVIQNTENNTVTMNFREVNPEGLNPLEMAVFNDNLYVGVMNSVTGFSVLRTDASGDPPYTFTPVITDGAYRVDREGNDAHNLNEYALSMCVFHDQLYVGTGCGLGGYDFMTSTSEDTKPIAGAAEMIRINPDDTWQLICGKKRDTPDGSKMPISLMPAGFGNPFAGYFWRMVEHDGWLYVTTIDCSVALQNPKLKENLPDEYKELLEQYGDTVINMLGGFDLWKTRNGVVWYPVDTRGFGDPFNIGGRTLESTPAGLFLGTANPFYGCQVWRAEEGFATAKDLQVALDGEAMKLTWIVPSGTVLSHIYKEELLGLDGTGFFGLEEVEETTEQYYLDLDIEPGKTYIYQVKCENEGGEISSESNIAVYRVPRASLFNRRIRGDRRSNRLRQNITSPFNRTMQMFPFDGSLFNGLGINENGSIMEMFPLDGSFLNGLGIAENNNQFITFFNENDLFSGVRDTFPFFFSTQDRFFFNYGYGSFLDGQFINY